MATSTEQLNDAIAALQGAADAYNGKKGEIDAALVASQAGYAALSANLRNVVGDVMYFNATVDPDEANPTNIDGGIFTSIAAAISAAPSGSVLDLAMPAGKTYVWDTNAYVSRKSVFFRKTGAGDNPVIQVQAYDDGGVYNAVRSLIPRYGSSFCFYMVDIHLPTAKANPALNWSSGQSFIAYDLYAPVSAFSYGSTITGGENLALMSAANGIANLGLYAVTLDGACFGVNGNSGGQAIITANSVTLQNGAAVNQGGILGTNLLKN